MHLTCPTTKPPHSHKSFTPSSRTTAIRSRRAFSKKVENLLAAVSLHFAHYNFVRVHGSLRVTPAMEARVSERLWSLDELVERVSS
jgi:hypothetical protein